MPLVRFRQGELEVGDHESEVNRDKESDKDLPEVCWKDVPELEEGFVAESMAFGMPGSKQEPEEQGLEELVLLQGASRPIQ